MAGAARGDFATARVRLYEGPVRTARCIKLVVLVTASVGAACHRSPHPWEGSADAGGHALGAAPIAPASEATAAASGASARDAEEADGGDSAGATPSAVRVGGPWVRCYGNFRVGGEPLKDVTRLAMLCGPENGMTRLSPKPLEGTVSEGGAVVTEAFRVQRGVCYRVFATATPSVKDLDVVVRSSRGAAIAADHGEDAWPIVQPDRPFCALEDDNVTIEVSARRGEGRFAAEIWQLRSAPALAPEEAARRREAGKP